MSPSSNLAAPFLFSCSHRSVALPRLIPAQGARFSQSTPACLRRDDSQHSLSPSRTGGAAVGRRRCGRRRISGGWCCGAQRRLLVLARWPIARDEYFASVNDSGV